MQSLVEKEQNFADLVNGVQGTSICFLLSQLVLNSLREQILEKYYFLEHKRFRYDPMLLLKLAIVRNFRNLTYKSINFHLSSEDCELLGISKISGHFQLPAGSTVHHFVKTRLGVDGFNEIMTHIAIEIRKFLPDEIGIIDSTPLEASRYDQCADFNPHYRIKMYKSHIFHLGDAPIFMLFSEGNGADITYAQPLVSIVSQSIRNIHAVFADAAYDSFEFHAQIWNDLGAHPYIDSKENAVINHEGTIQRIDHWVNKGWKNGGDIHASIDEKLGFLYKSGRMEQVGMFLRNQNLTDPSFEEMYKIRGDCEKTHNHIKSIVKFDVRKIREESKEFNILMNFVSYQLLIFARLQNGLSPTHGFAEYV